MRIALVVIVLLTGGPAVSSTAAPPSDSTFVRAVLQAMPRARHAVYFGVGYQPGPGMRLTGTYEYAGLPTGVLSFTGGWSEELLGAVGYRFAVDLGTWPPRQLEVSTELFSDFTPNRLLDDAEVDERMTGGRLTFTLQGHPARGAYHVYTRAQHAYVDLSAPDPLDTSRWLTALDLGGEYTLARRPILPDAVAGARLRVGWQHPEAAFVTLRAAGRWLRPLGAGFDAVVDGQAAWASRNTPAYEQASFGGMTGVRGYRPDAAVGRRLWTLQHELWAPLPGTREATSGLAGVLGRYVRLAAFFDVGGVARTTGGLSADVRTGFGLGPRLLLGPLTLRVDWAHRTTAVRDGHFRGDLYVSVRSNVAALLGS